FSEEMRYGQDAFMWCLLAMEFPLHVLEDSMSLVRRTGGNAVSRARAHLKLRAGLWENLISKISSFNSNVTISSTISITYRYCHTVNLFIDTLEGKTGIKGKIQEILARAFYLPAYLMF